MRELNLIAEDTNQVRAEVWSSGLLACWQLRSEVDGFAEQGAGRLTAAGACRAGNRRRRKAPCMAGADGQLSLPDCWLCFFSAFFSQQPSVFLSPFCTSPLLWPGPHPGLGACFIPRLFPVLPLVCSTCILFHSSVCSPFPCTAPQYGHDRRDGRGLAELLRELSKLEGLHWIRILYAYPSYFTDELVAEIAVNPKVCKYIDMPLQHINNLVLLAMNRPPQVGGWVWSCGVGSW